MRIIRSFLLLLGFAIATAGCAWQPADWDDSAPAPASAAMPAQTSSIDTVVYGSAAQAAKPSPSARADARARGFYTAAAAPPPLSAPPPRTERGLFTTPGALSFASTVDEQAGPVMTAAVPPPAPAPAPDAEQQKELFMAEVTPSPEPVEAAAPDDASVRHDAPPKLVDYAPAAEHKPYTLDSGDRLRVVVFGQDGLSNSYIVDASGYIAMPLIGTVSARGATTEELSKRIAEKLRDGYVKEPHVAVEIEAYRPFFILGEVTQPGQYPYVADMTVETAVAIAGGFGPRAYRQTVTVTRTEHGGQVRMKVPTTFTLRPGDTVNVQERWF